MNAKAWQVTLDDVQSKRASLESVPYDRDSDKKYTEEEEEPSSSKKETAKTPEPDPIRNEAVRIIGDLIELSDTSKTVSASADSRVAPIAR